MSRIRQRKQKVKHFREPKEGDLFLNAVALGEEKEVEDYLERGGSPHWTDCRGQTAMHVAAQYKQNKILERLLPFFDDEQLNQRDMYGRAAWKVAYFFSNGRGMHLLENRPVNTMNPRMYKSYSFKQKVNKAKKANQTMKADKANIQQWNMPSYLPQKKSSVIRSPIVYRSANKKQVFIADKRFLKKSAQKTHFLEKSAQKAQVDQKAHVLEKSAEKAQVDQKAHVLEKSAEKAQVAPSSPTIKHIHIAHKKRFLGKSAQKAQGD